MNFDVQHDLSGKTALIAGADRGFGSEIAAGMAAAGADIMGLGPGIQDDSEIAYRVRGLGRRFTAHRIDLSSDSQVRALAAGIEAETTGIDILVSLVEPVAAGLTLQTAFAMHMRLGTAVAAGMAARGAGKIVFVVPAHPRPDGFVVPLRELSLRWPSAHLRVNTVLAEPQGSGPDAEVVSATVFLASPASDHLSGVTLYAGLPRG